jgi:hypothetical protein
MRFKFWRDSLKAAEEVRLRVMLCPTPSFILKLTAECQGRVAKHPIAESLHELRGRARLPAYHLNRMIDARVSVNPIYAQHSDLTCRCRRLSLPSAIIQP